jgi:hypothetical protein
MKEFYSFIYDTLSLSKLFTSNTNDDTYQYKQMTGIDYIDMVLNKLILYYFYFKKSYNTSFNFDRFCGIVVCSIEYTSTIFMVISFIYFISYIKESIKNLLKSPINISDINIKQIYNQINKKSQEKLNEVTDSDNILFIKNKFTGEYEKFKLIRLIKDFTNLNFNSNNNNNDKNSVKSDSNRFEIVDYTSDQSLSSFQSALTDFSEVTGTDKSMNNNSKTLSLLTSDNDDDGGVIKVNSLSMLSQIVITKVVSSSIVPLCKTMTTNTAINQESNATLVPEEIVKINERLKKLGLKRLYLSSKCCMFSCIAYCFIYMKNNEFWERYEKKSDSKRPNLQQIEIRQQFIMKLRRIVYKYWYKNLQKFFKYAIEFDKHNNIECRFKSEVELMMEMKRYLNEGYYNLDSLGYTITSILSACLQVNMFLVRSDSIIKITPDMLGKIELVNISNIYLVQQSDGLYDSAILDE